MKILRWTVAATIVVGSGIASAADLPPHMATKAPPAIAPTTSWTGFYAGANFGWGFSSDPSVNFSTNGGNLASFIGPPPPVNFSAGGPLGGVQVGYNWQFDPHWVAGVEADFDGAYIDGRGDTAQHHPGNSPQAFTAFAYNRIDWFGTARGRFGYLPTDNFLIYATGGFAYAQVKQGANQFDNNGTGAFGGGAGELCFNFSNCYAGTKTRIVTGWTAGAGLEYLLSQHWTVKAEYLFVSLASDDFNMPIAASPGMSSYTAHVATETFHVTRAGINYKF